MKEIVLGEKKVWFFFKKNKLIDMQVEEILARKLILGNENFDESRIVDVEIKTMECLTTPFTIGLTAANRHANRA